jgi:probable rRNA maturation factor
MVATAMIFLEIDASYRSHVEPAAIKRAAAATLQHQSVPPDSSMTIVITDDEAIQQLNHEYRGVDAPTDVLAFPAGHSDPESDSTYLGDIIISYPRAQAQAGAAGHSPSDELLLLAVHGVLHLLGHDHAEPEEKTRMWAAQKAILDLIGCQVTLP